MLLNYINSSRDVSTIAHELGHCYHFRLNMNSNNFIFFGADCEVSSIFMEMLFIGQLLVQQVIATQLLPMTVMRITILSVVHRVPL